MRLLSAFISLCWCITTPGQGTFLRTYNFGGSSDHFYEVTQTQDSGFAVVGNQVFGVSDVRLLIAKMDMHGNEQWHRIFQRSWHQTADAILQTPDGGYMVAGDIELGGVGYCLLLRLNEFGDTLWTRTFGDSMGQSCADMASTHDRGYVMAGTKHGPGILPTRAYLICMDSLGDTLWTRVSSNGIENDGIFQVEVDDSGFIYLCGVTENLGPDSNSNNMLFMKYGPSGQLVWAKGYGDGQYGNYGTDMVPVMNGEALWVGTSSLNGIGFEHTVAKTNAKGTMMGYRHYGKLHNDALETVALSCNRIVAAGYRSSLGSDDAVVLLGLNGSIDSQWSAYYPMEGAIRASTPTNDCGFAFVGSSGFNGMLLKTDSLGCVTAGCHYTGMNEPVGPNTLSIFPNPTTGPITVTLPTVINSTMHLTITNSFGQIVMYESMPPGVAHYSIDLSYLPSGIYHVRVTGNGNTFSAKVIRF